MAVFQMIEKVLDDGDAIGKLSRRGGVRVLDLFAGIGGFSLAAHWMGWETVAFVEREKFCQAVLRKNFGEGIEIHDDICTFSGKPFRGRVDLITGGFPCQPFSAAGQRQGVNDDRYLFPESLRVIREVQPAWVVLENVNGLLSMANETWDVKVGSQSNTQTAELHDYTAILSRTEIMLLHCICEEIEREGYAVQPVVIPASAIGAWHERKRVWIVAHTRREYGARRSLAGELERPLRERDAVEPQRPIKSDGIRADTVAGRVGRDDRGNYRQERHIPNDLGLAAESESERQGRLGGFRSVGSNVADAVGARRQRQGSITESAGKMGTSTSDSSILAHPDGSRLEGAGHGDRCDCAVRDRGADWSENWIEAATRLCGMADGLPNRVDRLKSLGNSIVPQIAFEIFKAIETAERETETARLKTRWRYFIDDLIGVKGRA